MALIQLTTVENPSTKEVEYYYYSMPDISGFTRYNDQAKPLLEELTKCLENMRTQTEAFHNKQVEIIDNYQKKLEEVGKENDNKILKSEEAYQRDKQELIDKLASFEIEKTTFTANAKKNALESTAKIQVLTDRFKEYSESTDKELGTSRQAEHELKNQLNSVIADKDKIKDISNKSIEALKVAQSQIIKLKELQPGGNNKNNSSTSCNSTEVDELNTAFEQALNMMKPRKSLGAHFDSNPVINIPDLDTTFCEQFYKKSNQLKIKMNTTLPTFHGRPDNNIVEWLYAAKRFLDIGNYTDIEKVAVASNYLRDIAAQDYMLHEQTWGKDTWSSFTEYMRKKYTPANHKQIIRMKIKNLKQLTSVKDYYVDFRKLAIQAHGMNEEERMSWFVENLKPELAQHVYLKECTSIEDAYEQANLFETYNKINKSILVLVISE